MRTRGYRGRIISPDESDGAQIRTPRVASFLRDVALRDLAVHAAHAACVDGRGDVYQWGDGFFAQTSGSGDRKPVLTLRGKVGLISSFAAKSNVVDTLSRGAGHYEGRGH